MYCVLPVYAAALLHWGWRIPFLLAFITAVVGLMLRYHMPEVRLYEQPTRAAGTEVNSGLQPQFFIKVDEGCSNAGC